MSVHGREFCDCSRPVEHGKGDAAICGHCYQIEAWLKAQNLLKTFLLTEDQREKSLEHSRSLRRKKKNHMHIEFGHIVVPEEPLPPEPPNTLFTIVGYKPYFLIDRYVQKSLA